MCMTRSATLGIGRLYNHVRGAYDCKLQPELFCFIDYQGLAQYFLYGGGGGVSFEN